LLSRIVTGELEVGGLLPKEAELAEHYRVNRSVIREAVKLLEVHQLVRPVRRRGTEVLDPVASPSPEVLRAMLMPRPGAIDREVLADLLELRGMLEAEMSARACERRTDADLAALEGCLEELRATLHEPRRYGAAVGELVLAVARAGNNRLYQVLVHWHREIQKDLESLFLTMWTASEQHLQGQELLVDLIRKQQADEVRRLLVAYHRWATPRLLAAAALYNGEAPAGAEPVTAEESST
jgi:DNA-binding FadR family transcriptional regulator